MAYRGYSGAKTNKWGDCRSKTLFRQRKLRPGEGRRKREAEGRELARLEPSLGTSEHGMQAGSVGVRSLGTVFPICSCTETAAPREGREGGGAGVYTAIRDATLPTLPAAAQYTQEVA